MGSSKPPATAVDLVDSFARLVGREVEVVLADPGPGIDDGATVVLRGRGGVQRGTLAILDRDGGRSGVVRFERSALTDGQHSLELGDRTLGCRLLVQGARPLVLLWGAEAPKSRIPVPHPRSRARRTPVQRARSLAGRARRAVSRRARGRR